MIKNFRHIGGRCKGSNLFFNRKKEKLRDLNFIQRHGLYNALSRIVAEKERGDEKNSLLNTMQFRKCVREKSVRKRMK